ncbi:MAG TPA: AMP-binding protein [Rhizomicrobium sp.]
MIISRLPDLTFVSRGHAETLRLSLEAARIAQLAGNLSQSLAPETAIGLVFRSSPELVLWWFASLCAGLRPLVIQYPTMKQAQTYWQSSVRHTIEAAGLGGIICDGDVHRHLGGIDVPIIEQPLPPHRDGDADFELDDFRIIQLSSGTTGHRKAVEFTSEALAHHAAEYQAAMKLSGESDMIVSWLPLYHDMGYVACFVMPLMLGVPITMIDPEIWVRDKALLFEAIEAHRGTICYMPNFGFEVMARERVRDLSSIRLWISCSEPVKAATTRRFLEVTGTPESKFAACYAMAENVFAVTPSSGLKTRKIDDQMSCRAGLRFPASS